MTNIETTILGELCNTEEFARQTVAYLKEDFFTTPESKEVFNIVKEFFSKHNKSPNQQVCDIELQNRTTLSQTVFDNTHKLIDDLYNKRPDQKVDIDWLMYEAERWTKRRAITNAICEGAEIITSKTQPFGRIEELIKEALATGFNTNIGHEFFDDSGERYDFYHRKEERIPFDIDPFNEITNGGLPKKTLSVIISGTNCGKSAFMCHRAASSIKQGKNVLYITCEMAEERIAERIDANLMDINIDDVHKLSRNMYYDKIKELKKKVSGKLIVKEYPTGIASVNDFRALLSEIRIKKNFVPDEIIIDYLNICSSVRYSAGSNNNSYTIIKAVAEELRGLAVEYNVPILTATQTNRSAFADSDYGLDGVAESFGTAATADLVFALIRTEELDRLNQIMVKQLKNRLADLAICRRFVLGYDRPKFKFYDVGNAAQANIHGASKSGQPPSGQSHGSNTDKHFGGLNV